MYPLNRPVLTKKHGHGKVHETDCGWLHGKNAHPDWPSYMTVRADEVSNPHCSHC